MDPITIITGYIALPYLAKRVISISAKESYKHIITPGAKKLTYHLSGEAKRQREFDERLIKWAKQIELDKKKNS